MDSIQPILNNYLPMSLVPRQLLLTILENVAAEQSRSQDRFSKEIPMDEMISFYESGLLRNVITVQQGLVLRIAIPLASKQTAFTVFSSIAVPRPQLEPDLAIKWKLEAPYLAISEDYMVTAYLTEFDLKKYQIITASNMRRHDFNRNNTWNLSCNTFLQRQRQSITIMPY